MASQGLVAVEVENNVAGLIELNCETDFVARSDEFKQLVSIFVSIQSSFRFMMLLKQ